MANVCYPLPSADHAGRLLDGDLTALPGIALDIAGRAALVGTGVYIAGERKHVVKYALGGALAIEAFILVWLGTAKWRASLNASPGEAYAPVEVPGSADAFAPPVYP